MKKKLLISLIFTIVMAFVLYYFLLPPINISSMDFWIYLVILILIFICSRVVLQNSFNFSIQRSKKPISKLYLYLIGGIALGSVIIFLINIILSPFFQAKQYATRINVSETESFIENVAQVDFNSLPLLDKDSSEKLGDRVMGQMPELVSQFAVSNLYTQINYNDDIVRVTPLEYNGIIKFFTNSKNGVAGYITVNSVTGEASLTKLDKGMKYMPSALFMKNLERHVRFLYPFEILDEEYFEIDNDGNPYWIIPTIKYAGVSLREDIKGVIIVNPITGESKKYDVDDVPNWVDHVYAADLIIEQLDDWGQYQKGFFNSIFGQKNVVMTTDGYNYTVMDDDVYLYTGITSVTNDESNLGFVLVNLRTKETNFYSVPGAEEYSAMASAEGQVQQMNYDSTFPLLINLNGKATYVVSLKDNAGLVKMYGFIDVTDYQKVVVTDAARGIEEAAKNYLGSENVNYNEDDIFRKDIQITKYTMVLIDGNTYFYFMDNDGQRYRCSITTNEDLLPFISNGDSIKISYIKEQEVIDVVSAEK